MRHCRALLMMPALALLASCSTQSVEVRPIKPRLAEGTMTANARIAEGMSQMLLGNVGLAQEAFRKALRDDPANVDAMLGLAAVYDRMGRGDLARKHYEMALAIQPRDKEIYAQFAQSLNQQGEAGEAARVLAEISAISVAPETPVAVPNSVSVQPPSPMPSRKARSAALRDASAAVPSSPQATALTGGPTLVRLSLAEVELVTRPVKRWEATLVARSSGSATYRFEEKVAARVVLLNAARAQGLAARTRRYLAARGIGDARIGNAPVIRSRSAILYDRSERARAERIAAQFGFSLERLPANQRGMTLLLGRDAARDMALRPSA